MRDAGELSRQPWLRALQAQLVRPRPCARGARSAGHVCRLCDRAVCCGGRRRLPVGAHHPMNVDAARGTRPLFAGLLVAGASAGLVFPPFSDVTNPARAHRSEVQRSRHLGGCAVLHATPRYRTAVPAADNAAPRALRGSVQEPWKSERGKCGSESGWTGCAGQRRSELASSTLPHPAHRATGAACGGAHCWRSGRSRGTHRCGGSMIRPVQQR